MDRALAGWLELPSRPQLSAGVRAGMQTPGLSAGVMWAGDREGGARLVFCACQLGDRLGIQQVQRASAELGCSVVVGAVEGQAMGQWGWGNSNNDWIRIAHCGRLCACKVVSFQS